MKAIILLSGGIDSTVVLAKALAAGRNCIALSFDYSQRHRIELKAAQAIALHYDIPYHLFTIPPGLFQGSALTNSNDIAINRSLNQMESEGIPNTYVPARNTLFLAYAMGLAEQLNANEIHFGPNRMDQNAYPDCRPEFIHAFQGVLDLGTKQAVQGGRIKLVTPLLNLNKEDIIREGLALSAPLDLTISCYNPSSTGQPCGQCDACILRNTAFKKSMPL